MLADKVISWYVENGRQLPWRETTNPYYIWLSEIILQQTRIEQGRAYYEQFVKEYPTVMHLANASEQQVLKSWQGLGYYSRARNLHLAARHIAFDLGGQFPNTYEGISSLKGVGRYTAAAVASFAFGLPYPVIDGNVYRFIARLYGISTPIDSGKAYKEFEDLLLRLIDKERPALFNQALMDFGSLYCKPQGCDCENCIFAYECEANRRGTVSLLPVKAGRTAVKERYFYYLDIRWGDPEEMMLMQKRESKDIWQGLYELPLYESESPIDFSDLENRLKDVMNDWLEETPKRLEIGPCLTHKLTHRTIKAQFVRAFFENRPTKIPKRMRVLKFQEVKSLPISRLIDRYLSEL